VELAFAHTGWSHEQHVMEIGVPAAAEICDVAARLRADASRVFGATIPLEVEHNLAVRQQIATPSIRRRAALALICGTARRLPEPVVEALVR